MQESLHNKGFPAKTCFLQLFFLANKVRKVFKGRVATSELRTPLLVAQYFPSKGLKKVKFDNISK